MTAVMPPVASTQQRREETPVNNNTANPPAADVDGPVETVAYWRDRCREAEQRAERLEGKLDIVRSVVEAVA